MSPLFYAVGTSGRENPRRGYLILRCKITEKISYMQINCKKISDNNKRRKQHAR